MEKNVKREKTVLKSKRGKKTPGGRLYGPLCSTRRGGGGGQHKGKESRCLTCTFARRRTLATLVKRIAKGTVKWKGKKFALTPFFQRENLFWGEPQAGADHTGGNAKGESR